jgi:hypothetical protein
MRMSQGGGAAPLATQERHRSGIASHDLGAFVLRHSRQDLCQNLPGLWERGLTIGIIGAPHHDAASIRVIHRSGGSNTWESEERIGAGTIAVAFLLSTSLTALD